MFKMNMFYRKSKNIKKKIMIIKLKMERKLIKKIMMEKLKRIKLLMKII